MLRKVRNFWNDIDNLFPISQKVSSKSIPYPPLFQLFQYSERILSKSMIYLRKLKIYFFLKPFFYVTLNNFRTSSCFQFFWSLLVIKRGRGCISPIWTDPSSFNSVNNAVLVFISALCVHLLINM